MSVEGGDVHGAHESDPVNRDVVVDDDDDDDDEDHRDDDDDDHDDDDDEEEAEEDDTSICERECRFHGLPGAMCCLLHQHTGCCVRYHRAQGWATSDSCIRYVQAQYQSSGLTPV